MEQVFKKILDEDEHVIKYFKPHKFRFYFLNIIVHSLIFLFVMMVLTLVYLFPEEGDELPFIFLLVIFSVGLVSFFINVFFSRLAYTKRVFAYTNKRILIQGGIVGTDYKALDLTMIGATEVRVDLIDKIARKDTGTLKFGSQSTPNNVQGIQAFVFSAISEPYETYREIKKHIDSVK